MVARGMGPRCLQSHASRPLKSLGSPGAAPPAIGFATQLLAPHGRPPVCAARARLPVSASDTAEIVAFRSAADLREHVALVIGKQSGDRQPLVVSAKGLLAGMSGSADFAEAQ